MAALSDEVCIVRCHTRLSKELCLCPMSRAFVGWYCAQGEPEYCRVNVAQKMRNAWWKLKSGCAKTSGAWGGECGNGVLRRALLRCGVS